MNVVGMDRLVTGTTEHQIIHNLQKKKKCYFYSLLCNNMEVAKWNILIKVQNILIHDWSCKIIFPVSDR